jgi:hypothetical protein
MAKKPKGLRPAIEITVEIPAGTKKREVAKRIQEALQQVPTDVFENGETIVVRSQVFGPPLKPPKPKG